MIQRIVYDRPPVYGRAVMAFGRVAESAIYSYGDVIYNPARIEITPSLRAHEAVHGQRQIDRGVEAWWDLYFEDPQFRFLEELVAHREEWAYIRDRVGRNERRHHLKEIAKRLSGPLYGRMVKLDKAKRLIAADKVEVQVDERAAQEG